MYATHWTAIACLSVRPMHLSHFHWHPWHDYRLSSCASASRASWRVRWGPSERATEHRATCAQTFHSMSNIQPVFPTHSYTNTQLSLPPSLPYLVHASLLRAPKASRLACLSDTHSGPSRELCVFFFVGVLRAARTISSLGFRSVVNTTQPIRN